MAFCPQAVQKEPLTRRRSESTLDTGHTTLVCGQGPLDREGVAELRAHVGPLLRNCRCLLIDARGAEFIDSDGVRQLLTLADELEAAGKELRLIVDQGGRVERILHLLRLERRFRMHYRLEDAWAERAPAGTRP